MTTTGIRRRTFLRGVIGGAAAAIALPPLEAMFRSSGEVYADGSTVTRFGVWFWGNGVRHAGWIPTATGADFPLSPQLAPLEGVKPYLHVLTGMEMKTATHPHHSGMAGILTGQKYQQVGTTRDTIVSTFAAPSIDQVAAAHFEGQTPFRSLEVAVTRHTGTDEGTTFEYLSHNGPNNVNPPERSPAALFQRLFGSPPEPHVDAARKSVLDLVSEQTRSLQSTLGANDRARLEQHLDSIRTIEQRLRQPAAECVVPAIPTDPADIAGQQPIEENNRLLSDLMAMALACDLTRSFSIMFSQAGSGVVVWQVGATDGLHYTCHTEALPQNIVHGAVVFTMSQLAYFLGRLRDTPEGAYDVLHNSVILCTSELSQQNPAHDNTEFPILIAGRAGGALPGNLHYRSGSKRNTSCALLTALRAAGLPLEGGFGTEAGHVVEGVPGLGF
ncbi:MAG TPA: DUF1552 domain-containing protein [Kofleriaceae bacterium]|nr:DUF1552 domain-containing protein [Kofleriaceae bacterium]